MTDVIRIAAVGDMHVPRGGHAGLQPAFNAAAANADVLVIAGDITDYGLPEEAKIVASALAPVKIPVIAVLGNHDFESGHQAEVTKILVDGRDAVARAEDDVDEVGAALRLAEPVRERDLGLAPGAREHGEHFVDVARTHEDVEVLGMPLDPRVARERIRAADEERDLRVVESLHRARVEREGVAHGCPAQATAATAAGSSTMRMGGCPGNACTSSGIATL